MPRGKVSNGGTAFWKTTALGKLLEVAASRHVGVNSWHERWLKKKKTREFSVMLKEGIVKEFSPVLSGCGAGVGGRCSGLVQVLFSRDAENFLMQGRARSYSGAVLFEELEITF